MAVFSGVLRIVTRRFSRAVAFATLAFFAMGICVINAANYGYTDCTNPFGLCYPGYYWNGTTCTVCPAGEWKPFADKFNADGTVTNYGCWDCPQKPGVLATCDEVTFDDNDGNINLGRSVFTCPSGYYRKYNDNPTKSDDFSCEECPANTTGSVEGISKGSISATSNGSDIQAKLLENNYNNFACGGCNNTSYRVGSECVACSTIGEGAYLACDPSYTYENITCKDGYHKFDDNNHHVTCAVAYKYGSGPNDWEKCTEIGPDSSYSGCSNGADSSQILCTSGFYRTVLSDGRVRCKLCSQGTSLCSNDGILCAENYYMDNDEDGEIVCKQCPQNSGKDADRSQPNQNNFGPKQCGCNANYYFEITGENYSCKRCPFGTGKVADSGINSGSGGVGLCNWCSDGYYGSMSNSSNSVNRDSCTECPQFAKLESLGVCIRGRSDASTNDVGACYIQKTKRNSVSTDALSTEVNPWFEDGTGYFQIVNVLGQNNVQSCTVSNVSGYDAANYPAVSCVQPAGQYCVYLDVTWSTLDDYVSDSTACMKSLMWRAKDSAGNYQISDVTAEDILRHWGESNPWFCTDDREKAQGFVNCLTGNEEYDECRNNGNACVASSSVVKICQMNDDSSACVDVDY